jgi:predicted transcriptional regulator
MEAASLVARTATAVEVMDRRFASATPDEPMGTVVQRMLNHEVECALVWEAGVVVGMLGRRDLLQLIAASSEPGQQSDYSASAVVEDTTARAPLSPTGRRRVDKIFSDWWATLTAF